MEGILKHHYIPVSYLELFVDPSTPHPTPYIWIADFASDAVRCRAPKNVGAISDHNVVLDSAGQPNQSVERMLGEFESDALPIIRRIADGDRNLDATTFERLNAFVALQFVRVPVVRERLEDFFLGVVRKLSILTTRDRESYARLAKEAQPELTASEIDASYEFAKDPKNYTISVHSSRALGDALTLASKAEPLLAKMTWYLVIAEEPLFITSDNPVSLVNPKAEGWNIGHGLANPDTEVTFPLTPKICYWGVWADRPATVAPIRATPERVKAINLRTVVLAQKECYASSESLARQALAMRNRTTESAV